MHKLFADAIVFLMQVTFDIPDALAAQLAAAGREPSRAALEALALDGYRTGQLTESEVREMLGYETRMQVHALLKEHNVYLNYSLEEFERDLVTLRQLREEALAVR